MTAFTVNLTREQLEVVSLFCAVKDIRYYLTGVHVEVGPLGGRLVATNGHLLMVARIDAEQCDGTGRAIIDADTVKAALALHKETDKALRSAGPVALPYRINGAEVRVGLDGARQVLGRTMDGKFPDYQRVVPTKVSGEAAHYAPEYLATFSKAAKASGSRSGYIGLAQNGTSAALVSIGADDRYIGVLMPMRFDAPSERPSWIAQVLTAPQEERKAA